MSGDEKVDPDKFRANVPLIDQFTLADWQAWGFEGQGAVILGYAMANRNFFDLWETGSWSSFEELLTTIEELDSYEIRQQVLRFLLENPEVPVRSAFALAFSSTLTYE